MNEQLAEWESLLENNKILVEMEGEFLIDELLLILVIMSIEIAVDSGKPRALVRIVHIDSKYYNPEVKYVWIQDYSVLISFE